MRPITVRSLNSQMLVCQRPWKLATTTLGCTSSGLIVAKNSEYVVLFMSSPLVIVVGEAADNPTTGRADDGEVGDVGGEHGLVTVEAAGLTVGARRKGPGLVVMTAVCVGAGLAAVDAA